MATAAADLAAVVERITPDQYGAPTPCRDWDVRDEIEHLMWVFDGAGERRDYAVEEFRPLLDGFVARDFSGQVTFAQREMPGSMVASLVLADLVVHGWDLARATGQPVPGDDAVVATVHEFCVGMADQGRAMGAFGPEVAVASSAPLLDRTLGLTGRDPNWTPPTR
jgi:uncharacterized protein (TIGR03083 family)